MLQPRNYDQAKDGVVNIFSMLGESFVDSGSVQKVTKRFVFVKSDADGDILKFHKATGYVVGYGPGNTLCIRPHTTRVSVSPLHCL